MFSVKLLFRQENQEVTFVHTKCPLQNSKWLLGRFPGTGPFVTEWQPVIILNCINKKKTYKEGCYTLHRAHKNITRSLTNVNWTEVYLLPTLPRNSCNVSAENVSQSENQQPCLILLGHGGANVYDSDAIKNNFPLVNVDFQKNGGKSIYVRI